MTPITQLSSINVPEARLVVIKPYESNQLRNIEDAIRNSDLGVNPSNDGNVIRIAIPQLTEERRGTWSNRPSRRVRTRGSRCATSVARRWRSCPHQEGRRGRRGRGARAEKDLDKTTHTYTTQIDELVKHKEGELLEV